MAVLAFFSDLGRWFWRLVPANPILVRVVFASGRRVRHLYIRLGYLGILAVIVLFGVVWNQSQTASLSVLAKNATRVFEAVSIVQLLMVCVLAPVFAAGAITQEKDSQTYGILLSTPLTSAQIVFGSLLSRLYFVFILLLAGVPLLCLLMVYGGVTGREIGLSIALCAATAALTASIAIALSVIKIGTGRTILSFYMMIAVYFFSLWALAGSPFFEVPQDLAPEGAGGRMSWLAAFHPVLSLWVVLNKTPAPDLPTVAHHGLPIRYLLAYPAQTYVAWATAAAALIATMSVFFVRRGAKVGEQSLAERLWGGWRRRGDGGLTRRPRHVWSNPVAWREAKTKAAAGAGGWMRIGLVVAGLTAAGALGTAYARGLAAADTRTWLEGIILIEVGLALFVVTATAATSMTREREANTLELLLVTPLECRDLLWGKIRGLVTFALPMLALPALTMALFVLYDALSGLGRRPQGPLIHAEALLTLPVLLVSFAALACMVAVRTSIQHRRTAVAVLLSVGIVVFVFALPSSCFFAVRTASSAAGAAFAPLSPLPAVMLAVAPEHHLEAARAAALTAAEKTQARWIAAMASLAAAGVYLGIAALIHSQSIRRFDMIIRTQST